jgi:hypothetical protein
LLGRAGLLASCGERLFGSVCEGEKLDQEI